MAEYKILIVNKRIGNIPVSFTPEYYKKAFRNYQIGDYRYLIALFERADIDSFIGGCMTTRSAGYKREWAITSASESKQDTDIALFIEEMFLELRTRDLFEHINSAQMTIYAVIGLIWDVINGKQVITDFKYTKQKYFCYDKDEVLKINWGTDLREIPQDSALVVESKMIPIFLKVLKDFIRKEFGEDNWSSFLESFGEPFVIGTFTNPENKKALEEAVNSIGSSARGVKPEGTEIKIIESTRGTGDHDNYVQDCKRGLSFTLLGHEGAAGHSQSTQIGENTEALKVKHDIAIGDMFFIEAQINSLIKMIVQRNFSVTAFPKITIDKSSPINDSIQLEAAQTAYDMGGEIDPKLFNRWGIKLENNDSLKKADGLF